MKVDVEKNYSRSRVQDGLEKGSLKLISLFPVSTILKCPVIFDNEQATLLLHYTSLVEPRERSKDFETLNQINFISPQRKRSHHYHKVKTVHGERGFLAPKLTDIPYVSERQSLI